MCYIRKPSMPPQNIKSYIDIQQLDQISNFREAEGERVVRAYHFTSELGRLVSRNLEAIASPRTPGAIRIIAGPRGVGKSHLLMLIQTLAYKPRARALVSQVPQVSNAVRRLEGSSFVVVQVSGPTRGTTTFDFGIALREALRHSPGNPMEFDDTQWYLAIEHGQVCELICSKLFPGMVLLVTIDDVSEIFRSGKRELITNTYRWLSLLAMKARDLPIVVLLALDSDVIDPQTGPAAKLTADYQVDALSQESLRRIADQALFRKNPIQRSELQALYREALRLLPNFKWSEQEFIEMYPVHPVVLDVSPSMCQYCESFSLFGFMNAAAGRALGRRPLQLISLDELFDRFEFDLRRNPVLQRGLEVYDFLASIVIPTLAFGDRLKAKLILKGILLSSISGRTVNAYDLTDSLMLYEERSTDREAAYRQTFAILQQLENLAEGQLIGKEEGISRQYQITIVERLDPEAKLNAAAAEIAFDDPRLCALLVTLGGICFQEWPFSADALLMANAVEQRTEVTGTWRGTHRKGVVVFNQPVELAMLQPVQIERHEERLTPDAISVDAEAFEVKPSVTTPSGLQEAITTEVKVTYTYQWAEECCELDWQISLLPAIYPEIPDTVPPIPSLLFWKPGMLDAAGCDILKKAWVVYTRGEEVLGIEAADRLQYLELQVRELFLKLYIEQGMFVSATGEKYSAKNFWPDGTLQKRFVDFVGLLIQTPLDKRFPLHPVFKSGLTEREVRRLVLGLMGGLNPTDAAVQEYALSYAVPLHIVTEREGVYQLAVDRDEALSQPFISEVLRLVEASASGDPIPVQVIYQTLRREPYGLLEPVQQLIMMALIAGWRIELIDVSGLRVFGAAELTQDVSFRQYGTVRRTATISYSAEVLTEWCRLLTERPDLPELTAVQARKMIREALAGWYQRWSDLNLAERFNSLPVEMMTTRTWQLIITCKRYFETTSNAVEAVLHERISLEMGLARIVEVFSANPTIFQRARHEFQLLVEFLNWLPYYIRAKTYTLTAVQLNNEEINAHRRELTHFFDHPHRLLDEDKRRRFEATFRSFQDKFTNLYATKHEDAMTKLVNLETLEEFLASRLWRTFELVSQLNIANPRFLVLAQEMIKLIRESQCTLPVRDILSIQPACSCGFRVGSVTPISTMVEDLKQLVRTGVDYHRRLILQYRPKLSQNLRTATTATGSNKDQVGALLALISSGESTTAMTMTPGMVELINEFLKEETRVIPASPPAPFVLGDRLTKAELKSRLNSWLESLPDDGDLAFEMSESPFAGEN